MKKIKILIGCCLLLITGFVVRGNVEITDLKVDRQENPLGFDNPIPEFSWVLQSSQRGISQTAYEIVVSDEEQKLEAVNGQYWQSGKTAGNQSFGIRYAGKPLQSFTRFWWKVRIWNQEGQPSEWSPVAWFETGMMNPSDWKAKWISDQRPLPVKDEDYYKEIPNPLLRKEIRLKKDVHSARLYIAGLGYSIAYLNGQRVGDHMLDMPWTQYGKQVMYNTFDVTSVLRKGNNALGVMLGNGWYNPMPLKLFRTWNLRDALTVGKPCVKAQLRITYKDGSNETILSDESWKAGDGPVLMNSVYLGELYDARLEQKGWNETGFNDHQWTRAKVEAGPKGVLIARYIPPVRATKILKPVKVTEPKPGIYLFDF